MIRQRLLEWLFAAIMLTLAAAFLFIFLYVLFGLVYVLSGWPR